MVIWRESSVIYKLTINCVVSKESDCYRTTPALEAATQLNFNLHQVSRFMNKSFVILLAFWTQYFRWQFNWRFCFKLTFGHCFHKRKCASVDYRLNSFFILLFSVSFSQFGSYLKKIWTGGLYFILFFSLIIN